MTHHSKTHVYCSDAVGALLLMMWTSTFYASLVLARRWNVSCSIEEPTVFFSAWVLEKWHWYSWLGNPELHVLCPFFQACLALVIRFQSSPQLVAIKKLRFCACTRRAAFPELLGVLPLHKKTFAGCTRSRDSKALSGPLGVLEGTAGEAGSMGFQTCGLNRKCTLSCWVRIGKVLWPQL